MRASSPLLSVLVALAAGMTLGTASAAVRFRRPSPVVQVDGTATEATETVPAAAAAGAEGVVLPFPRPVRLGSAPVPARCGDTGGRTKAGAACAARAGAAGRCHHHRVTVASAA